MFLQAALSLREPYILKKPNGNLGGKDKAAFVAKDLGDFLSLYKKETEMFTVYKEESGIIPRQVFEEFVTCANESGNFFIFLFFSSITSPCRS